MVYDEKEGIKSGAQLTFRSTLRSVRLHGDVRIEVVQCSVCLLTAIPSALVHTLNLLVTATRSLVLLGTGDRHERVDLQ